MQPAKNRSIVVSALTARTYGPSARDRQAARLYVTDEIIAEYRDVLSRVELKIRKGRLCAEVAVER